MAAFTRRQYKGAAVATTTTNSLNTSDTSVTIASNTGWPSSAGVPFYVVIDPGTSAEEKCSATISGTTLTLTRAQDDTTASAHSSGATIYPVFTANDADEANELVSKLTTKGDLLVTDGSALNRLGVGTNGHQLTADSAATNGVKWALSPETDLVTTKGDLLVATAADTLARQGVGSNGQVLVADSGQTNGIAWVNPQTNRNVIINGGFDIWQRGTSSTVTGNTYLADRWTRQSQAGATQEQSTDVPTGQGFRYSWKHTASATNTYMQMGQQIEFVNCKHLQNNTVNISFWAKAINSNGGSTGLTVRTRTNSTVDVQTYFSGTASDTSVTLTTSWAKYTVSRTLPSTFGALSLEFVLGTHVSGDGFFLTGVQLEAGAVATPFEFEDIGSTIAKCYRYYYRNAGGNGEAVSPQNGTAFSTTVALWAYANPVPMRAAAGSIEVSNVGVYDPAGATTRSGGTWSLNQAVNGNCNRIIYTHGSAVFTVGQSVFMNSTNASNYFAVSAEL